MLKRRDFLRATLVGVASVAVGGCGDDEGTTPQAQPRQVAEGSKYFPQSIASGDPRADGMILWARLVDPDRAGEDVTLELEVALDEAFAQLVTLDAASRSLVAQTKFDGCVKARVTGLSPATPYFYRFVYTSGGVPFGSRVGRAKTAPAADADVDVRFAFVSCQDFIGRYYHPYGALRGLDIDFFVHLGDYVYETTGDPTFQETAGDRKVTFTDQAGAIELSTSEGDKFYAARSLDNYRDLYRTIRGDTTLQEVHEKFAMIATWDDHEFSDDAHGAVATYTDGLEDEEDVERKKAANQAWFEYMPVDYADDPAFVYDPAASFPGDIRIHRDFVFGKHLHLVMTDLRTHRADHLVPEDAFPGAVVVDEATLTSVLGSVPAFALPYIDVETYQAGIYKTALDEAAADLGYAPAQITGNMSAAWINSRVAEINLTKPMAEQIQLIDEMAMMTTLERGLSWIDVGKRSLHSSIGSRYFVQTNEFGALASVLFDQSSGASETVMGADQKAWFLDTFEKSTATFKVWGNEYCLTPLGVDLEAQPIPPDFKKKFTMNVDAWDGFPNERSSLIDALSGIGNVIAITGDIHAFYAATPTAAGAPDKKIVEFVTSSISSKTFSAELEGQVAADPILSMVPPAKLLAKAIDTLLLDTDTKVNPHLGYADSLSNGFAIAEVGASTFTVTFHKTPGDKAVEKATGLFKTQRFQVKAGEAELYMEVDGAFKRWDPTTLTYV